MWTYCGYAHVYIDVKWSMEYYISYHVSISYASTLNIKDITIAYNFEERKSNVSSSMV